MNSVIDILNEKFPNTEEITKEIEGWVKEQIYQGNPAKGWETHSSYTYRNTIVTHATFRDLDCIPCFRDIIGFPKPVLAAVSVNVYHNDFANTKLYFIKHPDEQVTFNKDITFEISFVEKGTTQHYFAILPFKKVKVYVDGPRATFRHITLVITILEVMEDG